MSVFQDRKKAEEVQSTQSGTLQKIDSVASVSDEPCTLDQLTYIVRQLQKRIAICEDKLSALDRALLDCQKNIQESKERLELLEIQVPELTIPDTIQGEGRKFFGELRNHIKADLDVATSGYLNETYTKNPSTLHAGIEVLATLGDVFFGCGSIVGSLITTVSDKVEKNCEGKKLKNLIEARAAFDVSNQGLANFIVTAIMNIFLELKNDLKFKPGFVVELSANIVKHLKENSLKDIEFKKSSNGDSITFSTEYAAKLKKRLLANLA